MELSSEDFESLKLKYFEAMSQELNEKGAVELVSDTHFSIVHKS